MLYPRIIYLQGKTKHQHFFYEKIRIKKVYRENLKKTFPERKREREISSCYLCDLAEHTFIQQFSNSQHVFNVKIQFAINMHTSIN